MSRTQVERRRSDLMFSEEKRDCFALRPFDGSTDFDELSRIELAEVKLRARNDKVEDVLVVVGRDERFENCA